jgi:hypothetical protein
MKPWKITLQGQTLIAADYHTGEKITELGYTDDEALCINRYARTELECAGYDLSRYFHPVTHEWRSIPL